MVSCINLVQEPLEINSPAGTGAGNHKFHGTFYVSSFSFLVAKRHSDEKLDTRNEKRETCPALIETRLWPAFE